MALRPVLARPVPAAVLTALVVSPVLLAVILTWTSGGSPVPIDFGWFGPSGDALLTGRWSDVFADPAVQAGPFELIPYGLAHLLGVQGVLAWTALLAGYAMLTAFLMALVLRPTLGPDLRSSVVAAGGTLILSLSGPIQTWTLGHPSEALVPLVWAVAGRLALRDRPLVAAALIAASSGFELWGVLGAPLVLLAPRPRLVRAALTAGATAAVLWLPLVLAGPFEMFSFTWVINDGSLVHLVQPEAQTFPWTWRLAQGVLAFGAGSAVALLLRRRGGAWGPWAVIATVVAGRLVLDPMLVGYYWDPVQIAAVGALVPAARRRDLVAAAGSAAVLVLTSNLGAPPLRAAVVLAICLLGAAALRWREERRAVTGRGAVVRPRASVPA